MTTTEKPAYSPGLAGVIAGETQICWVDPNAGLMYRGYDIHEMAEKASFEEVAYLLLQRRAAQLRAAGEFHQCDRGRTQPCPQRCSILLRLDAEKYASDGYVAHGRFDARRRSIPS